MASFISFKKVYKRYGEGTAEVCALNGMDFEIGQGELVVIVGPSGSGKTTLLNVLGGMDTCDDGVVMVDGQQVQHYSRKELIQYRRHEVGFVFQFYNLIQNLTALENVELAAQITPDFIPAKEILTKVGLGERLNNFPAQLSGGEQQRVAIARALVAEPEVVLADEPTGNLDIEGTRVICELLRGLNETEKSAVLLVTHDPVVAACAQTVHFLRGGRIAASHDPKGDPALVSDLYLETCR